MIPERIIFISRGITVLADTATCSLHQNWCENLKSHSYLFTASLYLWTVKEMCQIQKPSHLMKNRFCCFAQSFLSWLPAAALSVPFVSLWHSGTYCLSDAAGAAVACSPLKMKRNNANSKNWTLLSQIKEPKRRTKPQKAIPVRSCSLQFITTLFLIQICAANTGIVRIRGV